jgi:hypothetical protein
MKPRSLGIRFVLGFYRAIGGEDKRRPIKPGTPLVMQSLRSARIGPSGLRHEAEELTGLQAGGITVSILRS